MIIALSCHGNYWTWRLAERKWLSEYAISVQKHRFFDVEDDAHYKVGLHSKAAT